MKTPSAALASLLFLLASLSGPGLLSAGPLCPQEKTSQSATAWQSVQDDQLYAVFGRFSPATSTAAMPNPPGDIILWDEAKGSSREAAHSSSSGTNISIQRTQTHFDH